MRCSAQLLLFVLLFSLPTGLRAQPKWHAGTHTAYGAGSASISFLSGSITDFNGQLTVGLGHFVSPRTQLMFDLGVQAGPLHTLYRAQGRLGFNVGRTTSKWTALAEVHAGGLLGNFQTVMGTSYTEGGYRAGLGLQCTYWFTEHAGLFLWPQLDRTNAENFGLDWWNIQLPVGFQMNW